MRSSMLEQAHKSALLSSYLKDLSHAPLGNIILTRYGQHFYNVWNIFFQIYVLPLFIIHM